MAASTADGKDVMNDPAFEVNSIREEDDRSRTEAEKEDTCRICRSEGTQEEPLFYPCKCSGSIKFVHQDCLMEWLSHTNKKHCELCKTPFRFTKLYDSQMPDTLPMDIFVIRAGIHVFNHAMLWLRAFLVGFVWLVLLPWCIRWTWRGLFFMLDAGWAREPWIANLEAEALRNISAEGAISSSMLETARSMLNVTTPDQVQNSSGGPIALQLLRFAYRLVAAPWRSSSASSHINGLQTNLTRLAAKSTILSDFEFAKSLTSSQYSNKIIVDVLEGQIITFLVVVAFILVFLIREWVIQQQPILNAAAHVREAEQQLNRVDEARQRLRGDIREAEEQIRRLNGDTPEDDQIEASESQTRDPDETSGSSSTALQVSDASDHSDSSSQNKARSSIDWPAFQRRIRAASSVPPLVDAENADPETSIIRQLTDQLVEIIQDANQGDAPDIQGLSKLSDWVRTIPHDVDSSWLSQVLSAFEHLKSSRRSSQTTDDNEDTDILDGDQRPVMPPRGATAHVNEVLRALEEEIENEDSADGAEVQSGDGVVNDMEHRVNRQSARSSNTDSSWQEINENSQHNAESASQVDDVVSAADVDDATQATTTPQRDLGLQADNLNGADSDEQLHTALSHSNSGASHHHDDLSASEHAEDQLALHEESHDAATAASGSLTAGERPSPGRPEDKSLFETLANWFWGDIDFNPPTTQQVPPDNDIAADEAPFVHIPHGEHADHEEHPEFAPGPDPEVAAAAAEAGLDAEAVEDAEDIEGIMELIGMQGPIIGLIQTAMFCGVLVTATLWGALGVPYLFGKLALLFVGDPLLFLVILPLQLTANLGDLLIDTGLLLIGGFAHWVSHALVTVISVLFKGFPQTVLQYLDSLASMSRAVCDKSGDRLVELFTTEETHNTLDSGFLLVSIQAHTSLRDLKHEIALVFRIAGASIFNLWTWAQNASVAKVLSALSHATPEISEKSSRSLQWLHTTFKETFGDGSFTMTIRAPRYISVEPIEAFWSSGDRTLAVLMGYSFLAMMGAVFLLRKEPMFSSPTLQKIEKGLADVLRQAGGVSKVILIISIEMLAFPLYCGLLLDCALLPLFKGATFGSRLEYASRSPYMFTFLHWFLGTAYMFNFALFVSMCRRILRSGVLYFIRDPDDPTFHPVRDVLERSVSTQLRKIAFSALVYGLMVILCLGGVIWGIAHANKLVLPIRWSTPEPVLEFPLEFLFYNFLSPFLFRLIKPSQGLESVYEIWLRGCARQLRLSHFLFGERKEDEEGHYIGRSWTSHIFLRATAPIPKRVLKSEDTDATPQDTELAIFHKNGKYVRAPASDQVRIVRGQEVFLDVSEEEVKKSEADQECSLHGRPNQKFRNVYVPPWFRVRIGLFLVGLWTLSAAIGSGFTLVPLLIGRTLCHIMLPSDVRVNDIWSFAIGLHLELGIAYLIMKGPDLMKRTKARLTGIDVTPAMRKVKHILVCAAKSTYFYGFGIVVVPATFALMFQLYCSLPMRTYVNSMAPSPAPIGVAMSNATAAVDFLSNLTASAVPAASPNNTWLNTHTINVLPDWTLGFLYGRVLIRIASLAPTSLPAAAFRQITRNGYFDPDLGLATRAFVLPTLLFSVVALAGPVLVAAGLKHLVLYPVLGSALVEAMQTKLYRYSYPLCAGVVLAVWCCLASVRATKRWRSSIKDEVYLIGERLHNFGEKKPPVGSRSVARKERG